MSPLMRVFLILSLFFLSHTYAKVLSMDLKQLSLLRDFEKEIKNRPTRTGYSTFQSYYDMFYVSTIELGTPAQTFSVQMDTGSASLWLVESKCNTPSCNGRQSPSRHKFNSTVSTTFNLTTQGAQLYYGSGTCNVTFAVDKLQFAGFTVDNQMTGLAYYVDETFGNQPIDGIFGLGWADLAEAEVLPPFYNIIPQLDQKVFTVFMGKQSDLSAGRITFGAFDTQFCNIDVYFTPVTQQRYWQFKLQDVRIGTIMFPGPFQAISDTGTASILAPQMAFETIVNITMATYNETLKLYTVPCNKAAALSDFYFVIEDWGFNVPSSQYVVKIQDTCALAIGSTATTTFPPTTWVLGDPWIRTWCQHHDMGNGRIGFSRANCGMRNQRMSAAAGCSPINVNVTTTTTTSTYKPSNSLPNNSVTPWITPEMVTTEITTTTTRISSNLDAFFSLLSSIVLYAFLA